MSSTLPMDSFACVDGGCDRSFAICTSVGGNLAQRRFIQSAGIVACGVVSMERAEKGDVIDANQFKSP
jgi:hypothetical protein